MRYCYFDGALVEEEKASLSIHNLGVQRGFGIFDLFRGRNGKPVFMDDHLERFDRSQRYLGLSRLISKEEIKDAIEGLQQWNIYRESTFRLMLLGDGTESHPVLKPLFYIVNTDISEQRNPDSAYVILHEHLREYPSVKSINYFTSNYLHRKKMEADAIDVVYHFNNQVTEASRSNIFVIKDGEMFTPSDNILAGVTRKHILKFSNDILPTQVTDVSLEMLKNADEVFLSSTLKEVMPVVKIDGIKVGDGRVGAFTKKIQESFLDHLH